METSDVISSLITRARKAQQEISSYTQEQIDLVCLAAGWEVYHDENIAQLAELAVEETGMGNVQDKITKHKNKIFGVLADIRGKPSVGLIESDPIRGIRKYAKPVGVVAALTPVTNPTATPGSNALSILKGRNAVIFAPHPRSKKASALAVSFMRRGLKRIGAPEDLIQIIEEPSVSASIELMKQADLVLATGGAAMVKSAYSSGTPSYGVGPGNAVQIVAEDADIPDAAAKIAASKCFDYATSCSSENSVIIHESVYDDMTAELIAQGGHLCTPQQRRALQNWLWTENVLNPKIIAQSAHVIAEGAGIFVPEGTRFLMVEGTMPPEEDPFAGEKISPVLTVWKQNSFQEAFDLLRRITDTSGKGHSCGIHTFNEQYIDYLGEHMPTSRIVVRQPQAAANGGTFTNGMPSTVTLGCGTWGGNITTENISYRHFLNITWLSEPVENHRPSDEEVFSPLREKAGTV